MGVKVQKPKGHRSWLVVVDHQCQLKTKAVGSRETEERVKSEIEARLALSTKNLRSARKSFNGWEAEIRTPR
jgi:hypothetical protein